MFFFLFLFNYSEERNFICLSDIHLDPKYIVEGDVKLNCRKKGVGKKAGPFGEIGCDTPQRMFLLLLKSLKEKISETDFILIGGDSSAHDKTLSIEEYVKNYSFIIYSIQEIYSKTKIIPVLGNNDLPIFNSDQELKSFFLKYYESWKDLIPKTQKELFLDLGCYFKHVKEDLYVIVLNTNLFIENKHYDNSLKSKKQFDWLNSVLKLFLEKNHKVIIIGHHPPIDLYLNYFTSSKLVSLFFLYKETIKGFLFGHIHEDTFFFLSRAISLKINEKELKTRFGIAMSLPSIIRNGNPCLREYYYNKKGDLVDYVQYYADIKEIERTGTFSLIEEYSLKKEYDVKGILNLELFEEIEKKIKTNQLYKNKYEKFIRIGRDTLNKF